MLQFFVLCCMAILSVSFTAAGIISFVCLFGWMEGENADAERTRKARLWVLPMWAVVIIMAGISWYCVDVLAQ